MTARWVWTGWRLARSLVLHGWACAGRDSLMSPGQLSIARVNLCRARSGRQLSGFGAAFSAGMKPSLAFMGRPLPRTIFTSYAVAWLYLAGFIAIRGRRLTGSLSRRAT